MEVVKTYDNVGNISEKTYIEDSQGNLTETRLRAGKELDIRSGLPRIYYEAIIEE